MRRRMKDRLRSIAIAGTLALTAAVSGCQSACTSATLAPTHSDAEIARAPIPYAVVVDAGRFPPVYGDHLADALRQSGVFARVDRAGAGRSDAPLVATVTIPSEGAAVIPILTALTLGLFPTWADETWGLGFELTAPGSPAPPVAIDYRWRGATVLGWASALLNLAPGRSGASPIEGDRYARHVAATIAPHAAEIESLAASARP